LPNEDGGCEADRINDRSNISNKTEYDKSTYKRNTRMALDKLVIVRVKMSSDEVSFVSMDHSDFSQPLEHSPFFRMTVSKLDALARRSGEGVP
jgi:hypothetical protein